MLFIILFMGMNNIISANASEEVSLATNDVSEGTITERQVAKYGWKYKIVDGKRYKRKYIRATGEWVGKWIPA